MQYRLENIPEKKLIGMRTSMSFANNKTFELWRSFMPRRKEIGNAVNAHLISMQQYGDGFFQNFDIDNPFEKWAAVEVSDFNTVPVGMESFVIPAGLYAVFLHVGPASKGPESFNYIFREWLPQSGYVLDNRPHFEVMDERYKHEQADSEEELWLPVKALS